MREYFIGELIKKRRLELKLTQEQLCEGICEPITISRLENGKQTPSRNKLRALLQRLGMPEHKYYALVTKNEMQVADLQTEIISCNVLRDSEKALEKIGELEKVADPADLLVQQFILRSRAAHGRIENGKILSYDPDEKIEMLLKAIKLTAPAFDIDEICDGLYCIDEVRVINQIATVYSEQGQHKKVIDIYCQLLKYVKKHFENIQQSGGLLPLISYNYARELDLVRRYEEAIEIADMGRQACIRYGQYRALPPTIALMAECYHFLGDDEKSKDYYRQAYYIYKAIGNISGADFVKIEIKKYFSSEFVF